LQEKLDIDKLEKEKSARREPIVYGNFLLKKVTNNFSSGDRYGNGESQ
jgi:hypothetical protein